MSEQVIGWQYIDVEDTDDSQMVLREDGMMYVPKVVGHHRERVYIDERGITHFGDYDPEKDEELMKLRRDTADYKEKVRRQTEDMMEDSRWGRNNPKGLDLRAHIMARVNAGMSIDHVVEDKILQKEIIAAVKAVNVGMRGFVNYKPLLTLNHLIDDARNGVKREMPSQKIPEKSKEKQEEQTVDAKIHSSKMKILRTFAKDNVSTEKGVVKPKRSAQEKKEIKLMLDNISKGITD